MSEFIKSLIIPLLTSAILYFLVFHLLLPLYRRHRARYAEYLPVAFTSSSPESDGGRAPLRHRILERMLAFVLSFRTGARRRLAEEEDSDEELEWADLPTRGQEREARPAQDERRLSRDLEEGFRDDSDEE